MNAPQMKDVLDALILVTALAVRQSCQHDDTHRGGNIWEICDSCGASWADDEGGKPEWVEPSEITRAMSIIAAARSQPREVEE